MILLLKMKNNLVIFTELPECAVIKSNDNALKLYLTDIDRLNKIKTLRSRTEDKCNRGESLSIYFDEDTNKIILKCKNCNTIIDYVE